MLVQLTCRPDPLEASLLQQAVRADDALLLCDKALGMAFTENPFPARGYVRQQDVAKLGGQVHPSWHIIDNGQWLDQVIHHDKTVTW